MSGISVIGINGSPHKTLTTAKLLQKALAGCRQEGARTKIVHLSQWRLPFFNGRYTKRFPKGAERLFQWIDEADGLILASPVHWFNMSALMLNFIHHLTCFELRNFDLEGKAAAFLTSCEEDGGEQTINLMRSPLQHQGCVISPYAGLYHNKTMAGKSEDRWQLTDPELIGKNLVRLIKRVRGQSWDYGNGP